MPKIIHDTIVLQLAPTKEQMARIERQFGCCRFVYNGALEYRRMMYKEYGVSVSGIDTIKALTDAKKDDHLDFLKSCSNEAMQQKLRDLDTAFKNFFQGRVSYPNFKRKGGKESFRNINSVRVYQDTCRVHIPNFQEGIKFHPHKQKKIEGKVKNVTITRATSGKYYATVLMEREYIPKPKTGAVVGIDLGLKDLAITSDGIKYENQRHLRKKEKELQFNQRKLSRRVRGSRQYENQRKRVARLHEDVRNARKDALHKASREIVDNHDIICLEDLNVKGMIQNRKLAKSVSDAAISELRRMVEYKGDREDRKVVHVDRFFPSSKLCSCCGYKNEGLSLDVRYWTCPSCGTHHDRDENAGQNILDEGLRILKEPSGSGTESDVKEKQVEAFPLGESKKPEVPSGTVKAV